MMPGARRRDAVVQAISAALHAGDERALANLMTAPVVAVTDGGVVGEPVRGPRRVALGLLAVASGSEVTMQGVNGESGLVVRRDGRVVGVVCFDIPRSKVTRVWLTLNPEKLRHWN